MNIHEQTSLRQRLQTIQLELIEGLGRELGEVVTPKLERLVHILDWVRIEQFVNEGCGVGRPRKGELRKPKELTRIARQR